MIDVEAHAHQLFRFMSMRCHHANFDNYFYRNDYRFPVAIVMGGWDTRVVDRAVAFFKGNYADYLLMTGGAGGRNLEGHEKPQAHVFRDRALKMGVPQDSILVDDKSTNTGENVQYAKKVLDEKGISVDRALFVHMATSLMRDYQVILKQGEGIEPVMASPKIGFSFYEGNLVSRTGMIEDMVGDAHRLWAHAPHFLDTPFVPEVVRNSFLYLAEKGYDSHLVRENGFPVNLPDRN